MSVAIAHQASAIGRLTLQEAAKEAHLRGTALTVLHVPESVDVDIVEEQKQNLQREIADVLSELDLSGTTWTLQVATGADVAETVLDLIGDDVDLLVIGARRRSPVGKMFLGSVTQTIILRADVPVLVVKAPAPR